MTSQWAGGLPDRKVNLCAPVSSGEENDLGIYLPFSLQQSQRQTASQALHCLLTQNKDGALIVFTSRLPRLHEREAPCMICYCFTFLILRWQQVPAERRQKYFGLSSAEYSEQSLGDGMDLFNSSFDETDK